MPQVACVMMQKDEDVLLESWLAYHGHLFGFGNLYIIDNGSTLPTVRATLARFAARGVHVDHRHTTRDDYVNKGGLVGAWIRELDAKGQYDFFLPTDCDEFVIKQTESGFTCNRDAIHTYLETLRAEPQTLRIRYQLANHPLLDDCYVYFGTTKTFYAADCFSWTDHGHHLDGSHRATGSRPTALLHVHFHYMPFERLVRSVPQRWIGTVDITDPAQLAGYDGASAHLARYLLMNAAEYYGQFNTKALVHFPQLRRWLHQLGAPLKIPHDDTEMRMLDPGESSQTAFFVPAPVHNAQYFAANPDVAAAGMDGFEHFLSYGFREGRPLAPPTEDAPAPYDPLSPTMS